MERMTWREMTQDRQQGRVGAHPICWVTKQGWPDWNICLLAPEGPGEIPKACPPGPTYQCCETPETGPVCYPMGLARARRGDPSGDPLEFRAAQAVRRTRRKLPSAARPTWREVKSAQQPAAVVSAVRMQVPGRRRRRSGRGRSAFRRR